MVSDFSRIITLLRKEKGVTQKQAAEDLGVSQALLSHYEKGIRDRSGLPLSVEDIPSPEGAKDGVFRGSVLPTFNKKLISNSLNILYDKLNACPDKGLVGEISGYLMLAVYKMFRLVYGAGPKNTSSMFGVKKNLYGGYSDAAMHIAESNVKAILAGEDIGLGAPLKDTSAFAMTTESLSRDYPLYATSLLNLIKTSEARIEKEKANCLKQIAMFEGKLSNEAFVSRAPEKVVAEQREKLEKNRALLAQLEESEKRLRR